MPDKDSNWDVCNVEHCFGSTDNWLRAEETVLEAAETSCFIKSEELSEDELAMQLMNRPSKRANMILLSNEDSESPIRTNVNKKIKVTNTSLTLPTPCLCSSTPARTNTTQNTHNIRLSNSQVHGNTTDHGNTGANTASTSTGRDSAADPFTSELGFRKFAVKALTCLIMEVKNLNEKVNALTGAKLIAQEANDEELSEDEHTFPLIKSESDLISFERKLKDRLFFNRMTLRLANMEHGKLGMAVCAICSKVVADSIAMKFSWLGRLQKRCFSKLMTARLLQKSLHMIGKEAWSPADVNHAIAKWLSQSKTRINRSKFQEYQSSDDIDGNSEQINKII